MTLTTKELRYWLALWYAPSIGPITFTQLLHTYKNFEELFTTSASTLRSFKLRDETIAYLCSPPWADIDNDLRWAEHADHHIIPYIDSRYPTYLQEISAAPPILFVRGDVHCLSTLQLSIVGSRHPSAQGYETAKQFAYTLAEKGFTMTSGLALGIDAASHKGALAANGKTIAVMATGLDRIYPACHRNLAEHIIKQGAVVSEFPFRTPAKAQNFPRRNRIISGLSQGVLVVEAAIKSGSLITARYANEQNREVFAIPGSIHNPMTAGCHALIKQGAKLVTCIDDILEEFPTLPTSNKPSLSTQAKPQNLSLESLDDQQKKLLACFTFEPISIDLLIEHSKFSADYVTSTLLMLELQGYVQSTHCGYIRRDYPL